MSHIIDAIVQNSKGFNFPQLLSIGIFVLNLQTRHIKEQPIKVATLLLDHQWLEVIYKHG
jgi:hypothetical protein